MCHFLNRTSLFGLCVVNPAHNDADVRRGALMCTRVVREHIGPAALYLPGSTLPLDAEVRERAIGFSHAVSIFAALDGGSGAVVGIEQLVGELLAHALARTGSR